MASLLAARRQHPAATLCLHANAEAVRLGAPASARLKCALWQNNPPLHLRHRGVLSFTPQRQNSPLASSAAGFEFLSVFDPRAQGQESETGHPACSLSGAILCSPVFIKRAKEPLHILSQQVVRRREPNLRRSAAADADFLLLPHPVLQLVDLNRRNVDRRDRATQRRIGRRPGLRAALHHLL